MDRSGQRSPEKPLPTAHSRGWAWLLTVIYLAVNAALALSTILGANLREAADGYTWYQPAVALLHHGAFVDFADPASPQTYRQPMFPLFAAAVMGVSGSTAPSAIVVAQIIALLLTGLVIRRVAATWCPEYQNLAFGLVIFNPNALGAVHLVQSDTLFSLMMTLFVGALSEAMSRGFQLIHASWAGVALGAASLTRPTSQFLILLLPVLFLLLALCGGFRHLWPAALRNGCIAGLIAAAVVTPWLLHMQSAGHGLTLNDPRFEYRFVWDQDAVLEARHHALPLAGAVAALEGPDGVVERYVRDQGSDWDRLGPREQLRQLTALGYRQFFSYPIAVHLQAAMNAHAQFLFSGGAGSFHGLLGTGAGSMVRQLYDAPKLDIITAFRNYLASAESYALLLTVLALAFVAVTRILDVIGLVWLAASRRWAPLLIVVCLVGYFAALTVYVGHSRYRLAIDPLLMLTATIGFAALRQRFERRAA
jgi:hypothetical protein